MKNTERTSPSTPLRLLIWSAVGFQGVALAAQVVIAALIQPYSRGIPQESMGSVLFGIFGMLVYPVVGIIIFTRRPVHPIGWLFCVSQVGWAAANLIQAFGRYALAARPDLRPLAGTLIWFDTWPGYLSTALFLALILLFPDGRLPSPRWKPAAWAVAAWAALCMLASAFAPGPADPTQALPFPNPLGANGPLGSLAAWFTGVAQLFLIPLGAAAAVSLVRRFHSSGGQTREQLKWLAATIVVVILCWAGLVGLMVRYPTTPGTPAWALAVESVAINSQALIPIAAGIAILRYRLYEIDQIINQALVYFSLTAALALVYFACILILQTLIGAITGEGQSSAAIVLSTLAIAALFTPLRLRIQRAIDRRFYRQRYNTQVILDRFSGLLRQEVDLQLMSDRLVGVVDETLQPVQVALWIKKNH